MLKSAMFHMFDSLHMPEQPMSEVQSYYFGDVGVVIDDYNIRNEYSLSEFDIESDNLGAILTTRIDVLYTPAMVLHNYPLIVSTI